MRLFDLSILWSELVDELGGGGGGGWHGARTGVFNISVIVTLTEVGRWA